MIKLKNKHILGDLNASSISRLDKTLNILEYVNFRYIPHIDDYRYDNKGKIRTYVLGPGFIEQTFIEQMFEGNMGGLLVGIMLWCKNLFLQELILRFIDCKNCFNLFLFFERVQKLKYSLLTIKL